MKLSSVTGTAHVRLAAVRTVSGSITNPATAVTTATVVALAIVSAYWPRCTAGRTRKPCSRLPAGLAWLRRITPPTPPTSPSPATIERAQENIKRLWREAYPLDDPKAEAGRAYLDYRGLIGLNPLPRDVRLHPSLPYWFTGPDGKPVKIGRYPALMALVRDLSGKVRGLHRTYLQQAGNGKALVISPTGEPLPVKKLLALAPGATRGAAIRLYPVGAENRLAVAEGIETALAVWRAAGWPCWAALFAGNLANFDVPASVETVAIMADNDSYQAGQEAAKALARRLFRLPKPPVIKIVKAQARVDETPAATPDDVWQEAQPLRRELPPPESFPLDALGSTLSGAAAAMEEVIQSPLAVIGNSLLAGAGLATQGHADIEIDGRSFPLSVYLVTVAETGERKTATDAVALAPHDKRQRTLREVYGQEIVEYEIQAAAWKKAKEQALSAKAKTMQAKADALRELGPEPSPPVEAILMVEKPTYEGLVKGLARGQPSMGLFSDEGGRFLGGHGMNQENQLKTAAGLSKLWDGSPISRTRGGDGNILLYGRRLSVHLMIQPAVSALLFGNDLLMGQGLLSRCLVTWPESNIGKHRYREESLRERPAMRQYFARLLGILETPLPIADGTQNELNPRKLQLSSDAKRAFIQFHDHISDLCGPEKALHPVKGLAAKAAEHAARIAGILALVRDMATGTVKAEDMAAGIELCQFYLGEALRLFDAAADNPDLVLAERCLAWARDRGCRFAAVELYQRGPNAVRDKATADRILEILRKHGLAQPLPAGTVIDGKPRKSAWEVRP